MEKEGKGRKEIFFKKNLIFFSHFSLFSLLLNGFYNFFI